MTFDYSLLSPIGDHRSKYIKRSKGNRAKKRKRDEAHKKPGHLEANLNATFHEVHVVGTPPDLELLNYLTIGFNSTTRHLEALAQSCIPSNRKPAAPGLDIEAKEAREVSKADLHTSTLKPLDAVFVPRSDQPSIMHSHLPMLVQAASMAPLSSPHIKLVVLPKGAEAKLSSALGIPRVGLIGLMEGAPAASPLIEFVKQHVPEVEVPWLVEAEAGVYLPVQINIIHTTAPLITRQAIGTRKITTKI